MKTLFLTGVCGLALAGSLGKFPLNNPVLPPISAQTDLASPNLWTYSDTLYQGDALDLYFNTPHGACMGVVNPSGQFFYVIYPRTSAVGKLAPLMDAGAFTGCARLRVSTLKLKADPYTYGVYENQPVFTQSGRYRILIGDNLHIDDPALLQTLDVQYIHKPKPKKTSA